ncbi:MAG: hypothetical protein M3Y87_17670 [Myxococcota bacterium]|nr:hypothetical protein [Myxococcota bacterium]
MKLSIRTLALLPFCALAVACGPHVIRGGDPHPTALVPQGTFALEISDGVLDTQEFSNVRVMEVRSTLARGFHNALGTHATSDRSTGPTVLVIDECAFVLERVGYVGVLSARVRGRWLSADGREVGQFAGRPVPRNGFASNGQRQLEDLIEVMYEELLRDYAETTSGAPASSGGETAQATTGGGGIQ